MFGEKNFWARISVLDVSWRPDVICRGDVSSFLSTIGHVYLIFCHWRVKTITTGLKYVTSNPNTTTNWQTDIESAVLSVTTGPSTSVTSRKTASRMNKSSKDSVWARLCPCMQMHSNSSSVTEPGLGPDVKQTCGMHTQSRSSNVASGHPQLLDGFEEWMHQKESINARDVLLFIINTRINSTELYSCDRRLSYHWCLTCSLTAGRSFRFHQTFLSRVFSLLPPLDKKLVPLFQEEDLQQRALIGLVRRYTHVHTTLHAFGLAWELRVVGEKVCLSFSFSPDKKCRCYESRGSTSCHSKNPSLGCSF